MPMHKDHIPEIFSRNVFLSFMAGIGCVLITVIVFFVTGDRTLLFLGGITSLFCVGKGTALYRAVKQKRYEIIEGICYHADYPMKRPFPKIQVVQGNGQTISLMLDRNQKIIHGHAYRFYFKQGTVPDPKESVWFQTLRTDGIIGIEEIPDVDSIEEKFHPRCRKTDHPPLFP